MDKFLFIAGMQKCGTTALASWLVENRVAEYLVDEVKEPYIYSRIDRGAISIPPGRNKNLWRLDASVGYACEQAIIESLPSYNTKIVLCLRNHWDRIWSAYKMLKLDAMNSAEYVQSINDNFPEKKLNFHEEESVLKELTFLHFKPKARPFLEKYLKDESERLKNSTFKERLIYELGFLFTQGRYPFYSILVCSTYHRATRNILQKYEGRDLAILSMERLQEKTKVSEFFKTFLNHQGNLNDISLKFSLDALSINESKPDFSSSEFDFMRNILKKDVEELKKTLHKNKCCDELLSFHSLEENIN